MRKLIPLLLALPVILMLGCVRMSPEESVNQVGTSHTVTATFGNGAGDPLANEPTTFEIISGPNVGLTHNTTTNDNGDATFTYTSNGNMGKDTIKATAGGLTGTAIKWWSISVPMGSVNCDNVVNVSDSINIQRYIAGLGVSQVEPCPDIGDPTIIIIDSP